MEQISKFDLRVFFNLKTVDKKHQLKEDYVTVNPSKRSLKINDPYKGSIGYQRISEHKQGQEFVFKANKVFQKGESLYADCCEPAVRQTLSGAKNSVIFLYGQSKSGKSTTLLSQKEQGLMAQSMDKLIDCTKTG